MIGEEYQAKNFRSLRVGVIYKDTEFGPKASHASYEDWYGVPCVMFFGEKEKHAGTWSYLYLFEPGTPAEEQRRQARVLIDLIAAGEREGE